MFKKFNNMKNLKTMAKTVTQPVYSKRRGIKWQRTLKAYRFLYPHDRQIFNETYNTYCC